MSVKRDKTLKKERKVNPMKTLNIVTMPKGYYLTARYNGTMQKHEYYKTKAALNARIKELKGEGYILEK